MSFEKAIQKFPRYHAACERLAGLSPVLRQSAATVYAIQGKRCGKIAEEILGFVEEHYRDIDYLDIYVRRVEDLMMMQERFLSDPSVDTLGDSSREVSRAAYDLALLLSIVFTNHRYEIMAQFRAFLDLLRGRPGHIAAVGAGTGYELNSMAARLNGWTIEGYDRDAEARATAAGLLEHFERADAVRLAGDFPLDAPDPDRRERYDAIVLCEILEHLPDPARALSVCREYIKPGGTLFATMAVNLAQEDHIFLYPDAESCREQLESCGYAIVHERLAPVLITPPPPGSEPPLTSGNYIAVARPR